eukprot:2214878-Prymnesium_polylepis.1
MQLPLSPATPASGGGGGMGGGGMGGGDRGGFGSFNCGGRSSGDSTPRAAARAPAASELAGAAACLVLHNAMRPPILPLGSRRPPT